MSTKISLDYFGMPGEGATVKEAKADAGRKIERLVDESGNGLRVVAFRSSHAVVWRSKHGWSYALLSHGDDKRPKSGSEYGCSSFDTVDEATISAARHIADLVWSHGVNDDRQFFSDALGEMLPARLVRPADVRDLTDRAAWQRRYRAAKNKGHTDNECHHIASGMGHMVGVAA